MPWPGRRIMGFYRLTIRVESGSYMILIPLFWDAGAQPSAHMPLRTASSETPSIPDEPAAMAIVMAQDEARLYGRACEPGLSALLRDIAPLAGDIIDAYHRGLADMPRARSLLGALSGDELDALKRWQVANLLGLLAPGLNARSHEAVARMVGRRLALSCVSREELAFAKDLLYTLIIERVGRDKHE